MLKDIYVRSKYLWGYSQLSKTQAYTVLKGVNDMSQLGKICNACGRERSKTKSIMYHPETLHAYCESPYICDPGKHPNSPANLIERGYELKLISISDAQRLFKEHLIKTVGDPEKIQTIRNMVEKPRTIRIGDPGLATFLLDLQDSYGFPSISDAIRYCIQVVKENKGQYYQDMKYAKEEHQEKLDEKEFVEAIEQEKPLPEKVEEPETVTEPEKEEEWTF